MKIQICVGFFSKQRQFFVIIDESYMQVVDDKKQSSATLLWSMIIVWSLVRLLASLR